jgi:hypothetical protein
MLICSPSQAEPLKQLNIYTKCHYNAYNVQVASSCYYPSISLHSSGFRRLLVRYDLCFTIQAPFLKNPTLLGIYSGILALYLQCHAAPTGRTCNTKKNILYAICVLYILSVVSFALNLLVFAVSNIEDFFLKKTLR